MTWLNVSSGPHYCADWINFDLIPFPQLDLQADLFNLPFPDAVFDKVYIGHTLEHLLWDRIPEALTELQRVMTGGAELMVVGPDIDRAIRTEQPPWLIEAILAVLVDRERGPFEHKWTATGLLTLVAVQTVFPNALEVPIEAVTQPRWANPTTAPWQCAVQATKE